MRRFVFGVIMSAIMMITGCEGVGLQGINIGTLGVGDTGNMVLSLGDGSPVARKIQATAGEIHRIDLKVEPANKKSIKTETILMGELASGGISVEFSGLSAGPAKVSVAAFTEDDTEIGSGETTVKVKQGHTAHASIDLRLFRDDGGIKATVNIIEPSDEQSANSPGGTFSHEWASVSDPESEDYLVARSNVKKYIETWGHATNYYSYWGTNVGNMDGYLTYRYDFANPVKSAELYVETAAFNQMNHSGTGTGYGTVYVDASKDGRTWVSLISSPIPTIATVDYQTYNNALPGAVVGGKSIWVRARLFSNHIGGSSPYSQGQFGRSQNPRKTPVYSFKAK